MKPLRQLHDLSGRAALVTGGAGHVARAIGEVLAELGASVALTDRDARVTDVADALRGSSSGATIGITANLASEDDVRTLPQRVVDAFGRLDILVHAGAMVSAENLPGWTSPFDEQQADTWRRALEVNLTAPFVLTQAAAPALRRARGCVIAVGSIYGMLGPDMRLYEDLPMGNSAAYAASKGGLLQLSRWLATVLAPDVRVNTITLGGIERGQPGAFQSRYVARTPLGRMGREEDIKGVIALLASDAGAYITGQNIVIDGGFGVW